MQNSARRHELFTVTIFLETIAEIAQNQGVTDLHNFSAEDLVLLLEGELQTLSAHGKSSGAGFLVKQKISSLREVQSPKSKVQSPKSRKS